MGNLKLFVDRLAERGLIDRWAFLLFAAGGSAAIWLLKWIHTESIYVAVGAAMLMLAYAALVGVGVSKLRADQAGDNCYYVGLIYTLASLSFAIFTFDPANTATTIVQGFGVALATTVLGLILRVFFTQSRIDLVDAEESARIALSEAASQVRAQLDGVVQSFAHFAHQTQQHLQELRDQVLSDVEIVGGTARTTLTMTAEHAVGAIDAQAAESTSATRKITTAVNRLVNSLESHANALGEIEGKSRGQLAHLEALEKAAHGSKSVLTQINEAARNVQTEQLALIAHSDRYATSAETIAAGIASLERAATQFDDVIERRLEALKRLPLEDAEAAELSMRGVIERWTETVDRLTAKQEEVLARLEQAHASQVIAVGRHNDALENELARSRENVGKVHRALVDMTSEITHRLEATAAQ